MYTIFICQCNTHNVFFSKKEENASPHLKILHFTVQMCNYYNKKCFPSGIKNQTTKVNSVQLKI